MGEKQSPDQHGFGDGLPSQRLDHSEIKPNQQGSNQEGHLLIDYFSGNDEDK